MERNFYAVLLKIKKLLFSEQLSYNRDQIRRLSPKIILELIRLKKRMNGSPLSAENTGNIQCLNANLLNSFNSCTFSYTGDC
jgi:hypothetical protein